MLFNSLAFAVFLPVIFATYWLLAKFHFRWQNVFILIAGYVFYGWWDWRFLSLLAFTSTMDYTFGRLLGVTADPARRKTIIIGSIITNLGLLGIFKYYNFFIGSLVESASWLGIDLHVTTLSIVLPVGISFYTFQSLSYTLDVYRNKLPPVRNMIDFLAFVSFFPQLLAGPIERATRLLPLFCRPRIFDPDAARDGLRQMLWGLLKKSSLPTIVPLTSTGFLQTPTPIQPASRWWAWFILRSKFTATSPGIPTSRLAVRGC